VLSVERTFFDFHGNEIVKERDEDIHKGLKSLLNCMNDRPVSKNFKPKKKNSSYSLPKTIL